MPPSPFSTLPRQLEEARAELLRLDALWKKHGCLMVDDSELASRTEAAQQAARVYEGWKAKVLSDREELSRRQASCQSLCESIEAWERRRRPAAAIWATILGIFGSVIVGLCAGVVGRPGLGLLFAFIVLCLTPLPVLWLSHLKQVAEGQLEYLNEELDLATEEAHTLEDGLAEAKGKAEAAYRQWETAYQEYERVKFLHDLGPSVLKARERCETLAREEEARQLERQRAEEARRAELEQLRQSRWWQLRQTNWRDLRGVAFEQFLREVFEMHGYCVQATKGSGDMGIDLILTGRGRRVGGPV